MTHTDWTTTDDDLTLERTTPHGVFRARLSVDEYPDPPYFDGGDPVYRAEDGEQVYGGGTAASRAVAEALTRTIPNSYSWRGEWDRETFERYVRIFHGGTVRWLSSWVYQGAGEYAAVALPEHRRELGVPAEHLHDAPDATEWQAYLDGEVYVVHIERATFDESGEVAEWVEDEDYPIGGHYGTEWAKQAAGDELAAVIDYTARQMLPLEQTA